ncbi:MAG: glycoside hydrolase TIM-barrel-like domain-containing protein [Rickettsiaceae bacterium]|nr:glycoside hydrolase TIM-barrel-like domain-containing protein [Rickettsiaceae bacterium]
MVKTIVGQGVLVSYAADWSEYHHTQGGWYNLDPLWSSQAIDFIGIDAYFPLTNIEGSFITKEDIKGGFAQGEGYDYYIDYERNQKIPLEPSFAWKNLKYWWENTHINPDGIITAWQPRSKKIWFTEYGFPSIDKASNQPNVFFNPLCKDGGIPKYSNGEIDFSIQRKCIRAFIEFWSKEEYIENMFLWTWEARPCPAWPHMDIWQDGYLWEKGHWVNDKFGMASVASIILEISNRCKIDLKNIEACAVDEVLSGVIFSHQLSAKDAISILRSSYFFDINASDGQKISFVKRGQTLPAAIDSGDLIKLTENTYINEVNIAREQMLAKANIYFQNQLQEYETGYLHLNNEQFSHLKNATLRLPFVMTVAEATQIGRLLLKNAATENKILEFNLPISYIDLQPADFVSLEYKEAKYYLRVIKISFTGLVINVIALVDDINSYHNITNFKNRIELSYEKNIETEVKIIELPFKLYGYDFPYLTVHLNNKIRLPIYVRSKQNLNPSWNKIALIEPTNSITRIVNFHVAGEPNSFLIDELSAIEVRGIELEKLNDNNWKLLEINSELIAFKNIKKIPSEEEIYSISHLIRGTYGTQGYIKKHEAGSVAAIFTHDVNILSILEDVAGQTLEFKIGSIVEEVHFTNCAFHYSIPLTVLNYVEGSKLHLQWINRNFNFDSWMRGVGRLKDFSIKLTAKSQVLNFTAAPITNQIEIDISEVDISEGYKIDII